MSVRQGFVIDEKVRDCRGFMVKPPRDFKQIVAAYKGVIVWSRHHGKHRVRYGLQVETFDGLGVEVEAAKEFGLFVRHLAECDGRLDND